MYKPNEYTDNIKSNLTWIFLSVMAKLKKNILPLETVNNMPRSDTRKHFKHSKVWP
jgi:hypothetical protein